MNEEPGERRRSIQLVPELGAIRIDLSTIDAGLLPLPAQDNGTVHSVRRGIVGKARAKILLGVRMCCD